MRGSGLLGLPCLVALLLGTGTWAAAQTGADAPTNAALSPKYDRAPWGDLATQGDARPGGCSPQGDAGLLVTLDGTWSVVPFGGGLEDGNCFLQASPKDPCQRCDDDYSAALPLGFNFDFYGTPQTSVHINNNGNLTFGAGLCQFIATGFPNADHVMVAPFWADVDTTVPDTGAGVVYFKSGPGWFAVTWDHVGHYAGETDRQNTFQVVLTDGTVPFVGVGNNVAFSYGEMGWTTGDPADLPGSGSGFGDPPATVGVNKGDGIEFFQLGRFDRPGTDYDGPTGNGDGVDWLEGQQFFLFVGEENAPPVPVDFPSQPIVVRIGETLERSVGFIGPEDDQTVSVTVDDGTLSNFDYISAPGNPATVDMTFTPSANQVGDHVISFVAVDDDLIPGMTEVSLTLRVPAPGPNAGGVLLVHTDDSIAYTSDGVYAGASGISCAPDPTCPPYEGYTDCVEALGRANPTSGHGSAPSVWWVLAAFPPGTQSCPRLTGITFGADWTEALTLLGYGSGGDFELPTSQWPAPGEGTAVTWQAAQRSQVAEVYWFAGYSDYGSELFALEPHPTQGGNFADDSVPAVLDLIDGYGTLGLNGATGSNPFPGGGATGACCPGGGSCLVLDSASCAALGATYQGDGVACSPKACPPPTGACCEPDGTCTVLTAAECEAQSGSYLGDFSGCDPHPCSQWYARGSYYGSGSADEGNDLNDDGTNGDAVAGDGIFSGFVTADVGPGIESFRVAESDGTPAYPSSDVPLALTESAQDVFFRFDTNGHEDDWLPSENTVWSDAVRAGTSWSVFGTPGELGSGDPSAGPGAFLRGDIWMTAVRFSGPVSGSYKWTADSVGDVLQVGADGYGLNPVPVPFSVTSAGWVLFEYDRATGRVRDRFGVVGACCLTGESCEVLPEDVCLDLDGEFHGIGTECDPSPCVQPVLALDPTSFDFGTTATEERLAVTNAGTGELSWSIGTGAGWLTVDPASGTTTTEVDSVTVFVDRSKLGPGSFEADLLVSSNGGDASVPVSMTVPEEPILSVAPDSLIFGDALASLDFTIGNVGTGTLSWSADGTEAWIDLLPTSGTTTTESDDITVTVDRNELAPGEYLGSVVVMSDGGNDTLFVSLTVPESPVLSVTPLLLEFGLGSTQQTFEIRNTGTGTLDWTSSPTEGWLQVTPADGTTTGETDLVTVTANRKGLDPGDYEAIVAVFSDGGNASIAVTLSVPEEPTLSVTPETLDLANTGIEAVFEVTNSGSGTLDWTITPTEPWLGASPATGTTTIEADEITVSVDRSGLAPGDHTGLLQVASNGGDQIVTVNLTVDEAPELGVAHAPLDFGTSVTERPVEITNPGTGTLMWTATPSDDWILVDPATGTTSTETDILTVSVDRSGLVPGSHSGSVLLESNGGKATLDVTLVVPAIPTLSVSTQSVDLGLFDDSQTFRIRNTGTGTLEWTLDPSEDWLTVDPTSGSTTTEADEITIFVDRSGLPPGGYRGAIGIVSNDGDASITVDMSVPTMPGLGLSATSLDFGETESELALEITNLGSGTLEWTATADQAWILVSPTSGTTMTETDLLIVTVDRLDLPPGSYAGKVTVTSNAGAQEVDILLFVPEEPALSLSPTSLDLGTQSDGDSFVITNTGTGTLEWTTESDATWLTASPPSGSTGTAPSVVNVSVDRAGLPPGSYAGSVTVSSNAGEQILSVAMTVPEAPVLGVGTTALAFGNSTVELEVGITNTGTGLLTWTAARTVSWAAVAPTSGETRQETDALTVTVDRKGLAPGTYTGSVTLASNGGGATIPVTMSVPTEPTLSLAPLALDLGTNLDERTFTIRNTGTGALDWSAGPGAAWLTIQPSSGRVTTAPIVVTVHADRTGLAPGEHLAVVAVTSNGGAGNVSVRILVPEEPALSVSVASLDFGAGNATDSFDITNPGTGTLTWTIAPGATWITVTPESGSTTDEADTIQIDVDRNGLDPGDYDALVTVSSNVGGANVAVTMRVQSEVPVEGACCDPAGICSIRTQQDCDASGGTYHGDGVECGPTTCPPHVGACCHVSGICTVVPEEECQGSETISWTRDEPCAPNPCRAVFSSVLVEESQGGGFGWKIESDPGAEIGELVAWYRPGGASTYVRIDTGDFSRNGNTWRTPFDPAERSARGLEYYLTFRLPTTPEGLVQLFGTEGQPNRIGFAEELAVPFPDAFEVRMIAAPAEVETGNVYEALRDLLGESGDQSWLMGRWNPAARSTTDADGYEMVTRTNPSALLAGKAYWLGVAESGLDWKIDGTTRFPRAGRSAFEIVLEPGWNMVGNPAAYPVSLASDRLQVDAGNGAISFSVAVGQEWVSQIYVYDPTLPANDPNFPYQIDPPVLEPWNGCWIRNRLDVDIVLLVPAAEADGAFARGDGTGGGAMANEGTSVDWGSALLGLTLDARSTGEPRRFESRRVELGVVRSRTEGVPLTAYTVPHGPGEEISLGLVPPGAEASAWFGETYRRDVRLSGAATYEWRLEISSATAPVRLTWSDPATGIPGLSPASANDPEWSLTLRLEGTERTWAMDQLHSLELPPGRHELVLQAVPGTIPEEPTSQLEFYADPNPFGESTALRYRLPAGGDVQLEVFSALGVRVWRREESGQEAGDHVILWDGSDDGGRSLPAGAYFLSVRARWASADREEATEATRKIVIVR